MGDNVRLIDADELKQRIAFRMWDVDDACPHDEGTIRISEDWAIDALVDKQPTVEAVPVIRCKECIRWRRSKTNTAAKVCDWDRYEKTENDYCSWAKRKEE